MAKKRQTHSAKPLAVFVMGLSGSGRSSAIKALEDLSFHCVDSLPVDLLEATLTYFAKQEEAPPRVGIGVDLKDSASVAELNRLRPKLEAIAHTDFVFLTADEDVLLRRYSTTRRKHPLIDASGQLQAAIRREAHLLAPLQDNADVIFDTSGWSPHFLTRTFETRYANEVKGRQLHVTLVSFGFKYGILRAADSVFDIRFLKNPYFDPKLKDMTGLDRPIADFIFSDPNTKMFVDKFLDLHAFLLPNYYREGKHYFRIGIGCTGGMHRSVLLTEHLARRLSELELDHVYVSVSHRDLNSAIELKEKPLG